MNRTTLWAWLLLAVGLGGCENPLVPAFHDGDRLAITRIDRITVSPFVSGQVSETPSYSLTLRIESPLRIEGDLGGRGRYVLGLTHLRSELGEFDRRTIFDTKELAGRALPLAHPWVGLADESFLMRFDGRGQVAEITAGEQVDQAIGLLDAREMFADRGKGQKAWARYFFDVLLDEPMDYLPTGLVRTGDTWPVRSTPETALSIYGIRLVNKADLQCRLERFEKTPAGRIAHIAITGVTSTSAPIIPNGRVEFDTTGSLTFNTDTHKPVSRKLKMTKTTGVGVLLAVAMTSQVDYAPVARPEPPGAAE